MKIRPRSIAAAVTLGVLTTLFATACGSEELPGPAATVPAATAAPAATHRAAAPAQSVDDLVESTALKVIRDGTTISATDRELLRAVDATCSTLDDYPTRDGFIGTISGIASSTGWARDDTAFVVGVAIAAKCPRHTDLVES